MKGFLADNWCELLLPALMFVTAVISVVRLVIRKRSGSKDADVAGLIGRLAGGMFFRGLPFDVTGAPPSGHFQKPDFSYDEEEETRIMGYTSEDGKKRPGMSSSAAAAKFSLKPLYNFTE